MLESSGDVFIDYRAGRVRMLLFMPLYSPLEPIKQRHRMPIVILPVEKVGR